MFKRKLLFILFLFTVNLFAQVKEVFVVSEKWDGYTNKDKSGLYFDIVRQVFEPLGIKVKIEIYPYNRSVKMIKEKKADFWLGSFIDEEEFALYPKYHFDIDRVTAMFKKDKFKDFKSIKDLKDKKVAWIRGYDYQEEIDVPMQISERNNRKSLLKSLKQDRIDVYLDDERDMRDALKKNNFDLSSYKLIELLKFNLYPAFRKDKIGEELSKIWDKRLSIMIKDGSLKNLYINYKIKDYYPFK